MVTRNIHDFGSPTYLHQPTKAEYDAHVAAYAAHIASIIGHPDETLAALLKGGNITHIPTTATGWTAVKVDLGDVFDQDLGGHVIHSGANAGGSCLLWARLRGFGSGANYARFNFAKKSYFVFNYARETSVAGAIGRVQIKQVNTLGALADKGIGIKVLNLALWGESYGTEPGEVYLETALTSSTDTQILIVHDPSVPSIKWYVNGVLKITQSTPVAAIPTSALTDVTYIVHSIENGITASAAYSALMIPRIWQAR